MSDPYYTYNGVKIYHGDAGTVLPELPAQSVNCCVTSPPYWNQRNYGHDGQLGLESTPEQYVERMVDIFRKVRHVLRDDGTVWLNLGDSYVSPKSCNGGYSDKSTLSGFTNLDTKGRKANESGKRYKLQSGLPPKHLVGIPWRVAFALQADGWYLRQDIIWHKPNPMPESVQDRCTKAHEYIFLLSKQKKYYYDADAIKEQSATLSTFHGGGRVDDSRNDRGRLNEGIDTGFRNKRSVWTTTTKPYPDAHFAVYPPKLIEPCIKAGCPEGGVVLDPFLGSGTTADVARNLGRKCVGIELSEEYIKLCEHRLRQGVLEFRT